MTLNRFCGSGAQAVNFAAMGVMSGRRICVVAGGVESMSRVPMGSDGGGSTANNLALREEAHPGAAGHLAPTSSPRSRASPRDDVDRFALASQHKAERRDAEEPLRARASSRWWTASGKPLLDHDEHPRAGATIEALAKLEPAFAAMGATPFGRTARRSTSSRASATPSVAKIDHVHTAGNSSGIVDGAAAVLLASEEYAEAHGITAARAHPGDGDRGRRAGDHADRAGARVREGAREGRHEAPRDIDLWEINEAFAAVPLQTAREAGDRPGADQRERRRHRARSPARRDRRDA